MPEARITLGQATAYLATAPKSNASYLAIDSATRDVESGRVLDVPDRLKSARVRTAGEARSKDDEYTYPHDHEGHFVDQEYARTSRRYYVPTSEGYEDVIGKRMARWAAVKRRSADDRQGDRAGQSKAEGADPEKTPDA
jgi:putative ATPase